MNDIIYFYLKTTIFVLGLLSGTTSVAQQKQYQIRTIAFYNCENLFDTLRDPKIYDEEWTPTGARGWTKEKYEQKIANIARVLAEIGREENPNMPVIIGLAEVENRAVLEDLVLHPALRKGNYGIVHFDSPDKRGIDVALLYAKDHFILEHASQHALYLYDQKRPTHRKRIYTRDQLLVSGLLDGEAMHFIVNHWPSRVGGQKRSSPNREAAAALNKRIIDSIQAIHTQAKIITMGDLNDGPMDASVKKILQTEGEATKVPPMGLFNPMEKLAKAGYGTLAYRDAWDIFDQIILTQAFLQEEYTTWKYWKANIFQKPFIVQSEGVYQGYPLRNSNNEPGFSDHFPVYLYVLRAW
ncbi:MULTISPECIES: endonuclease/exonuclease/phosphatase family protein [unclassified Myroides]|uniref:endonuclease/exonuclease/phosphatase family protein n=1 Tax=unclassified Myroides TaxID=2642485 RepID=UPI0015FE0847|nr:MULTISPECIES: endonuclease/exonuclease/phosphatase family protein [unclassified Myroides]MBB1149143.1 endonuclease/exonuclease/phosphatase family protein [Myroides sp. NP-2]MDM1406097.1 endonuclease/exonuclease/phosphatase family protein [Myroides sp. DF42-4-2]